MLMMNYKLLSKLGRGSFGVVKLAIEKSTGKKVAIKILIRDILLIGIIFNIWFFALRFALNNNNNSLVEAIQSFPGHLLITICYNAVCNVCYSILFISDCVNEHKELLDELEEGRKFFTQKGIKYN